MALVTLTARQALQDANARLVPLQTDVRLDSAAQALVGELVQANNLALSVMNAQSIIPSGQRTARAQQIEDKVRALGVVCDAHQADITVDAFYNALDLSMDAAGVIRLGVGSFSTTLV